MLRVCTRVLVHIQYMYIYCRLVFTEKLLFYHEVVIS